MRAARIPSMVVGRSHQREEHAVWRVSALRAGGRSLRAIAADLDGSGVAPRGGARWRPHTVANIARVA